MSFELDPVLLKAFFEESSDILVKLSEEIATLADEPNNKEITHSIFRGIHTIKGNSSFLNLVKITELSHTMETLLDKIRKDEVSLNEYLVASLKSACDELSDIILTQDLDRNIDQIKGELESHTGRNNVEAHEDQPVADLEVAKNKTNKIQVSSFIKMTENKFEKMISIAMELEIIRNALEKFPERIDDFGPEFSDFRFDVDLQISKLSRLTKSLNGLVLGVRLVPVSQVFKRFPSIVSELAFKLGKQVFLEVKNADAELDKSIVDAIAEPMTHLIRNAVDHGIESMEERSSENKPPFGTITLSSYVKENFVFIEISDDGKGIDTSLIVRKAIELGIVPAEKVNELTESQKLALIFAPGFSTAEKVTEISGRGVGMDVVKNNINKLKGTVTIDSKVGVGTTIQLRFPMSMVVLLSLFVEVNATSCSFPVEQIDESFNYLPTELLPGIPSDAGDISHWAVYSLKKLLWGLEDDLSARKRYHVLRMRNPAARNMVFLVEEFGSIEESVIQSVDSYISALPGIQGAAVRKDGSVTLVLNVDNIVLRATREKPMGYVRMREKELPEADRILQELADAI